MAVSAAWRFAWRTGLRFSLSAESLNGIGMSLALRGLAAAGAGVTIRLNSSAPSFMDRSERSLFALSRCCALAILFAIHRRHDDRLAGTSLFRDQSARNCGSTRVVILWFLLVPLSAAAMLLCARRALIANMSLSSAEESAGGADARRLDRPFVPAGHFTIPPARTIGIRCGYSWRSFSWSRSARPRWCLFRKLCGVSSSASLIVLHFLGIGTAVSIAVRRPLGSFSRRGPRIYQPYLEFMYLNNAYHFYSPEPGPGQLSVVSHVLRRPARQALGPLAQSPRSLMTTVGTKTSWRSNTSACWPSPKTSSPPIRRRIST